MRPKKHVLILADTEEAEDCMRLLFEVHGCAVDVVRSREDALRRVQRQGGADVILVLNHDAEIVRGLADSGVNVVVRTAGGHLYQEEMIRAGAFAVVLEGNDNSELVRLVKNALVKRRGPKTAGIVKWAADSRDERFAA